VIAFVSDTRDYDPRVGRWTAKDPIGFGGANPNLFGYAFGDPINAIDPSGLQLPMGPRPFDPVDLGPLGRAVNRAREVASEIDFGGTGGQCGCGNGSSFGRRVLSNFMTTNEALPTRLGLRALTIGTASATAEAAGSMTLFQFARTGFAGATLGAATYTATETAIIVAGTTLLNAILVDAAFETGVAVGSVANVLIEDAVRRSRGCR